MKRIISITAILTITGFMSESFSQAVAVKLWPEGVPGSIENRLYKERNWTTPERNYYASVSDPEIHIYPASKDISSGTAVIICPGGGYTRMSWGNEGTSIAEWFNNNGITAIILKYRLPSDSIMTDKSTGPLQDAQQAVRIVRRRAAEWGIDADKIGIMGFSAGGHLASTLATHFNEKVYEPEDAISARPDFAILIYPVITMTFPYTHKGSRVNLLGENPDTTQVIRFSNQYQVTKETPPVFIVHSTNDKTVPVINSIWFYQALIENKVIAEMHIFQQGKHGFGLAKGGSTESLWPDLCTSWLRNNGFISAKER